MGTSLKVAIFLILARLPQKKQLLIGTNMLLIITSTGDELISGFSAAVHTSRMNCDEMDADGLRLPANRI